jgi:spermidine synthase
MSIPGKEIYRGYDEFGVIRVLDDGNKRYLSFGDVDEQSCWLKSEPNIPQHEYVRAMLLVLLFCEPKRCISLGLGAGSLNSCLHFNFPSLKQEIVELRAGVIDAAYKYFQLPRSKRLLLHQMDAQDFLQCVESKKADIIFSDIYGADGLDEQQLRPDFIHECYYRLKPGGWLVLNCWRDHQGEATIDTLRELFPDIRSCATQSGNWLIFAGTSIDIQSAKQLKTQARELSQKLGFSLTRSLNKLEVHTHT